MTRELKLLATDLDRTLIPNGEVEVSPQAKPLFDRLCASRTFKLVYVSGRSMDLIQDAIASYDLPQPDYAISDVGTALYQCQSAGWTKVIGWNQKLFSGGWSKSFAEKMRSWNSIPGLRLQEPERQTEFKISFYVHDIENQKEKEQQLQAKLEANRVQANFIWSYDDEKEVGLLDVLPKGANKLNSLLFLANALEIEPNQCLFSGDSGNDLEVLASHLPSVLVKNATSEVRKEALALAESNHHASLLYLAKGNKGGLNGNYASGILEGISHFFPQSFPLNGRMNHG